MNSEPGLRHFRAFAARLQPQLATLLHEPAAVRCLTLKTARFSFPSGPAFFYRLTGEDVPEGTVLGFGFDAPLFFALLDRLQGGDGTSEEHSRTRSWELTRFESRLVARFLLLFQGALRQTWNFPEPYDFEPLSSEEWKYGETLSSVEFLLDFGNVEGAFRILRPAAIRRPVLSARSASNSVSPLSSVVSALSDTPIRISVQLSGDKIRPRDLLSWNVGDIIPLGRPEDFPFSVQVEGIEKFTAVPGKYQSRKAFKIL